MVLISFVSCLILKCRDYFCILLIKFAEFLWLDTKTKKLRVIYVFEFISCWRNVFEIISANYFICFIIFYYKIGGSQ